MVYNYINIYVSIDANNQGSIISTLLTYNTVYGIYSNLSLLSSLRSTPLYCFHSASGSGKSTLLNALALRLDRNILVEGEMLLCGKPYNTSYLKQVSGYVMQDDLLNGNLTVEETLFYTAQLRMDAECSIEDKENRCEEVLQLMGLSHCRNTVVGTAQRKGISGGERKRLCVGMELLSSPAILFLDEVCCRREERRLCLS
jgi:ABC-type multidrug transport system ATPase subunit